MAGNYTSILGNIKYIRENVNLPDVIFRACELYQELRGLDINSLAQINLAKLRNREIIKKPKSQKGRIFHKIMKKFM
jgi:hypothetical protein